MPKNKKNKRPEGTNWFAWCPVKLYGDKKLVWWCWVFKKTVAHTPCWGASPDFTTFYWKDKMTYDYERRVADGIIESELCGGCNKQVLTEKGCILLDQHEQAETEMGGHDYPPERDKEFCWCDEIVLT